MMTKVWEVRRSDGSHYKFCESEDAVKADIGVENRHKVTWSEVEKDVVFIVLELGSQYNDGGDEVIGVTDTIALAGLMIYNTIKKHPSASLNDYDVQIHELYQGQS